MSVEIIRYAFTAGELSPRLQWRADADQWDKALAKAENWFVDYRGGLSTRAGQEFVDYVWRDDKPTKFVRFHFSPEISNNYVVLFGDLYVRFLQDGAYVLETPVSVTAITNASPGVMSVVNTWAVGDWLKVWGVQGMKGVNNEIVQIKARTGTTVTMSKFDGTDFSTVGAGTFVAGGAQAARIYTVTSPYPAEDLELLQAHQIRDTLRLTHHLYEVRNLKRKDHADWTLTKESFGSKIGRPGGLTVFSVHGSGPCSVGYVVTAVDKNDEEGLPTDMKMLITNDWNNPTAPGGATLKWNPVVGARYYNVYRTILLMGANASQPTISRSQPVGFLSRAQGGYFSDLNIVPDFTRTPPARTNPFANGEIEYIEITNTGSGYAVDCTMTVSDPNDDGHITGTPAAGFVGYPLVDVGNGGFNGPIKGIMIINGGHDYTDPTFTITAAGGGSNAKFKATVGPLEGNYPAASAVFQQRQEYAGTDNDPLTLWGSKPGLFANFDTSQITLADDSYEFELDAEDVAPIRHMVPTRPGLLMMTATGIWVLTGGGQGSAVTATNPVAEPHVYKGAAILPPERVDTDVIYLEAKGTAVRKLAYNDVRKIFDPADISILSNHMLNPRLTISAWSYADEPFHQLWSVRSDGDSLALTVIKDNDPPVFAWTHMTTQGRYLDALAIEESNVDRLYFMVERTFGGVTHKYIERRAPRMLEAAEDAMCLDCALALDPNFPNRTAQVAAKSGEGVLVTASAATFGPVPTAVGKVIRGGGGKMVIVEQLSTTQVKVNIVQEITAVIPFTDIPRRFESGEWTYDAPVTVVSGFKHLAGQPIKVLADGNYIPNLVPDAFGEIVLPQPATRVAGGLGYRCVAQTLPLGGVAKPVIEGRRKRIVGVATRVIESRGLLAGTTEDTLYQMKDRTDELWGEPTKLFTGLRYMGLEPVWDDAGQMFFVQEDPLPVSILGYVVDAEIGEEDDTK